MNIFTFQNFTVKNLVSKTLSVILVLFASLQVNAQAPSNDDPCAAIPLTVGATCAYQTFTTANATGSTGFPAPGCASYAGADVWFQVVVPAGGALIIDTQTGVITDGGMALYSGDCNTMTLISCDDDTSPNGLMPMITASGLTPGSTVWVRVWEYGGNNNGTFGICVTAPPPPPANDNCTGATSLTVNATAACTVTTPGTTQSATATVGAPAPTCSAAGATDDVWYSFVATNTIHTVSLSGVTGTATAMAMAVYSGASCAALTGMQCGTGNTLIQSGLTVGQTYYVRVWTTATTTGYANFNICVSTPPPPPANDDPCAAITLTATATCTYQTFTTASATNSTGFPAPGCASFNGGDVWFQVTVPASGALIFDTQTGVITDGGMAIYSGDCNTMTLIECDDDDSPNGLMPRIERTGLTPGSTIWIRVWEYGNDNPGTFGICVTFPPPPPANDNCSGAVMLTVNSDLSCAVVTAGTTQSGTASTGVPTPTCSAAGATADVCFSFVATSPFHRISLLNITGTTTAMAMQLYSGTSCAALTGVQCLTGATLNVGSLTVGQTYYIRVWTTATTTAYASFNICVGTPPPPPVNDEPCNATLLTVDPNGQCNFQPFNNISALGSTAPAPGCANYQGGDVWYKVVVPCTGTLTVDSKQGTVTDAGMAFYRGTCNNLTLIECNDDGSSNGAMPLITRTGLTPGDTIYVRFWEYGNDNQGTYEICASSPLPPIVLPPLPPSPTCGTAQPFCTSTTPYVLPNVSGGGSVPGQGIYGCLFTVPNPTYYTLQIQTSGSIELTISQTSTAGVPIDVDFVIWGPFTSAASCSTVSASNIVDCSYSADPTEIITIPNAVAGQFYILLVTNYNGGAGQISYQQTGGTGSSSCCTINATNSGPRFCQGGGSMVNFTSTAVANATYIWTGPNCFTSNQQNPTGVVVPAEPGQYVYTVTAYTPTGQVCSDTTIVTVIPRPSIGADTTIMICEGSTVDLTTLYSTGGLTTAWTLNGSAVTNPAAAGVSGNYQLIASNATNCNDTAIVRLTIDSVRSTVNVQQIICTRTGTITVTPTLGIAPFEYSISTNPGVFQSSNEFVANEGSYTITVRDSLGCTNTVPATVTIIPELTVSAGPDLSIVSGESIPLVATASGTPSSILWSPATGLSSTSTLATVANPAVTSTYTITITNSQGCVAEDEVIVTVIPYCVRVKNAFTPNGDGINETWEVYDQFDCLTNVSVNVFNRYGNLVFSDRNYRNKWTGVYQGKPVPDGTYYAVVEFTMLGGRKFSVKTDLTILR